MKNQHIASHLLCSAKPSCQAMPCNQSASKPLCWLPFQSQPHAGHVAMVKGDHESERCTSHIQETLLFCSSDEVQEILSVLLDRRGRAGSRTARMMPIRSKFSGREQISEEAGCTCDKLNQVMVAVQSGISARPLGKNLWKKNCTCNKLDERGGGVYAIPRFPVSC